MNFLQCRVSNGTRNKKRYCNLRQSQISDNHEEKKTESIVGMWNHTRFQYCHFLFIKIRSAYI